MLKGLNDHSCKSKRPEAIQSRDGGFLGVCDDGGVTEAEGKMDSAMSLRHECETLSGPGQFMLCL